MRYVRNLILVAVFSLFGCIGVAEALVIDEFEGNGNVVANGMDLFLNSSAIGGARLLRAQRLSGSLNVTASTQSGIFLHSADALTAGLTEVVWDGGSGSLAPDHTGLGGIDFGQDYPSGDPTVPSILVRVVSNDLPNGQIEITVWSTNGASASVVKTVPCVNNPVLCAGTTSHTAEFLFSEFVGVSFDSVGALRLKIIDGTSDRDLAIDWVRTNAPCELVPDQNGRVVDDCGVCGGTNQDKDECGICFGRNADKDDCGVCFGENKDKDDCGVCFGENQTKDDCGVCDGNNESMDQCGICDGDGSSCLDCLNQPFGSAKFDICGICDGDGTSCLDCRGEPFGSAKVDICGICEGDGTSCLDCEDVPFGKKVVDECGVCGGDGTSCTCVSKSSIEVFELIDTTVNQFHRLVRQTSRGFIGKKDVRFVKRITRLSRQRLINITAIKKIIETTTLDCQNERCVTETINLEGVDKYRKELRQFNRLIRTIMNRYGQLGSGGRCTRTPQECAASAKAGQANVRYILRTSRRLLREGVQKINSIPTTTSVCY